MKVHREMKPGHSQLSPRYLATRILLARFEGRLPIEAAFSSKEFLRLETRDQALAREIIDGVCRRRGTLDFYIRELSRRPLEKLDAEILWILRTGIYQIQYLRVSSHAAVHETVGMVESFGKKSAKGFVNAVLRSFLRSPPSLPDDKSAESVSVRLSHPEWLVRRYLDRYGFEVTQRFLERNNQKPESVLWVNPNLIAVEQFCEGLESEGIVFRVLEELPGCVLVEAPGFIRHPLYREGFCCFMDFSSQMVAHLVKVRDGLVGDFCAAPGGKAFIIASRLKSGDSLVCGDISLERLKVLQRRAELHQVSGLKLLQIDSRRVLPFRQVFRSILLDVPCSGLGTLRSNPEIRWLMREDRLGRYHKRQSAILRNGFDALGTGGDLVYSTCSTEPEENEEVVEEFLDSEPKAALAGEYLRTYPDAEHGDGFFAARVRRL